MKGKCNGNKENKSKSCRFHSGRQLLNRKGKWSVPAGRIIDKSLAPPPPFCRRLHRTERRECDEDEPDRCGDDLIYVDERLDRIGDYRAAENEDGRIGAAGMDRAPDGVAGDRKPGCQSQDALGQQILKAIIPGGIKEKSERVHRLLFPVGFGD